MSREMLPARLPRANVRRTYTWIAPFHDLLAVLVESRARRMALAEAQIRDGASILEVAVGTGLSFREVVQQNPSGTNVGIDITSAMIGRTRRRIRKSGALNATVELGDAYDLKFESESFDLLLNSYMMDMIPLRDFETILDEFARVLKPGGRLILVNMSVPERWWQSGWDMLYQLHPPLLGGCRGIAVAPYLPSAGFDMIRRTFVSQLTFPSEVIVATKN